MRDFLKSVSNISRDEVIENLEKVGLKLKGKSPDGRFMEFVDKNETVRAKIHPPDKVTKNNHLHIYDSKGNSQNANLDIVKVNSPEGHIKIQ